MSSTVCAMSYTCIVERSCFGSSTASAGLWVSNRQRTACESACFRTRCRSTTVLGAKPQRSSRRPAREGLCIGIRNLERLQLRQHDAAERRHKVLADDLGIALERLWRQLRLHVGKPTAQEFRYGLAIGLLIAAARLVRRYQPRTLNSNGVCCPLKLCHLRFRLPAGSRLSSTIAQRPGERSRMCPFILCLAWLEGASRIPARRTHQARHRALVDRKKSCCTLGMSSTKSWASVAQNGCALAARHRCLFCSRP